jgi:enolase-phosphatase E1
MNPARPRVYLLDVEGTVAPVSLVSEQLFPYARTHFSDFLKKHIGDPAVRSDLLLLAEENRADNAAGVPRISAISAPEEVGGPRFRLDAFVYLIWLMDRDRKSTALKSLQGRIWKGGFESGQLKGTVFPDVPPAFERWSNQGKVVIYSSGSVEAQQLLFRHSSYGDLTPLISSYFDTRVGPKPESVSYSEIAAKLGVVPAEIKFFSDVVSELDAAREAGCETGLVVREGNAPVADAHGHPVLETFERI